MKYCITLKQDGGVRDYIGPILSARPARPLRPEEVPLAQFGPAIAELVARAIGWEFFNTLIPEGSVGVEIGVDVGDGAERLLQSKPSKLHLVDPWLSSNLDAWYDVAQSGMDERHKFVIDRFLYEPSVEIHRSTSAEYLATLPDNSVDWVFIDGDHDSEPVYRDLIDSYRVTKPGGYIAGDDMHGCQNWSAKVRIGYERFMSEYGDRVDLIWDGYAPFILRKKAVA